MLLQVLVDMQCVIVHHLHLLLLGIMLQVLEIMHSLTVHHLHRLLFQIV